MITFYEYLIEAEGKKPPFQKTVKSYVAAMASEDFGSYAMKNAKTTFSKLDSVVAQFPLSITRDIEDLIDENPDNYIDVATKQLEKDFHRCLDIMDVKNHKTYKLPMNILSDESVSFENKYGWKVKVVLTRKKVDSQIKEATLWGDVTIKGDAVKTQGKPSDKSKKIKPGAILSCISGYSTTNVDFFLIKGVDGNKVHCVELGQKIVNGTAGYAGEVTPDKKKEGRIIFNGTIVDENQVKITMKSGAKELATLWHGKPITYNNVD